MSERCTWPGCSAPGYLVMVPGDMPTLAAIDTLDDGPTLVPPQATCAAHERLIRRRMIELHTPRRAAYLERRPHRERTG